MDGKQKTLIVVISALFVGYAVTAVVAAGPYTPLYTLRMEQMSSEKNFLPTEKTPFTYTAEPGCTVNYPGSHYCGETPLYTGDPTCPRTCELSCDGEPTCEGPTCYSTCYSTCPNTCPNTCADTCPNTCEETCPETCIESCIATCYTCPATCPWTCSKTCSTCYSTSACCP